MRDWKEGSKRLERRSESKEKPRKKKLQRDKGGKGSEERTMSMCVGTVSDFTVK